MLHWIISNKSWVFSGIGVLALGMVSKALGWYRVLREAIRTWRARHSFPALVRLERKHAEVTISGPETGYVRVHLAVANLSRRGVAASTVTLSTMFVGGTGFSRDSAIVGTCDAARHSVGRAQFTLTLRPEEINRVIQSIGPAPNRLSTPYADVHTSGCFDGRWGKRQVTAWFDYVFPTTCRIADPASTGPNNEASIPQPATAPDSGSKATPQPGGGGGKGGGGNAIGSASAVIGGRGGRGGPHGVGRGGDGGGGDAIGDRSIVIGGDGGDAGRVDGRGGAGAPSPLKKLPAEFLKTFGLTGTEGYGAGGHGANSQEYDRRMKLLMRLSAEYAADFPGGQVTHMPGALMPPAEWVNDHLAGMTENFRVEFIDNGEDFLLIDVPKRGA